MMLSRVCLLTGLTVLAGVCHLLTGSPARADVRMPEIFGDHMVLQQDTRLPIWGWANPDEAITVSLGGQTLSTKASADGSWRVELTPIPMTAVPLALTVRGKNILTFQDVLLGDVWLSAGQSNMEIPLVKAHNAGTELPKADDPQMRFFVVRSRTSLEAHNGLEDKASIRRQGVWRVCSPETSGGCSAVTYFFGRNLRQTVKRPIGLVVSTFYSSPAEGWTRYQTIEKNVDKDPGFQKMLEARAGEREKFPQELRKYEEAVRAYEADLKNWDEVLRPKFNADLRVWNVANDKARAEGKPGPEKPSLKPKPQPPLYPEGGGITIPGNLYNGMVAPVIPYAIKGIIWYQGEGNTGRSEQYKVLFPLMIADWRNAWGQGDIPFLFVQLTSFGGISPDPCPPRDTWPLLREAQAFAVAQVKGTGMAATIDVGDPVNIHPRDKMDVGVRLALIARHQVYGEDVLFAGPTYQSMRVQGNKIRLTFGNVGGGLVIAAPPWTAPGQPPVPVDQLLGFAIAGTDRKWVWAQASIEDQQVVVYSRNVTQPVAVRYAWSNSPIPSNLYNRERLPAFPFRTDNWNP